jgi:vanillate O-demethylase monooxygenase subunit
MLAAIAKADPQIRNYPLNCWRVAGYADEIGRRPLARWLLDTPVVLYRTGSGAVVALEDRCPHRQAPLSIGQLRGDAIECGYHGFQFGQDGRCVRVPSMSAPPPIRVQTYPVQEIGPLVWIYLGDTAVISEVPAPPALPWISDDQFALRKGYMPIAANYMLLKENVLDLTHFGYVHAATFGISDWVDPPQVRREKDAVFYRQDFVETPLIPGMAIPLELEPGTPWNRRNEGGFLSPAVQQGGTDFFDPSAPDIAMARMRFAHLTTPIDSGNMHYFYVFGRDYAHESAAMDIFETMVTRGFKEDEVVLEQIQALVGRKPRRGSEGERSVKADAAGIEARRIVDGWMNRETIKD